MQGAGVLVIELASQARRTNSLACLTTRATVARFPLTCFLVMPYSSNKPVTWVVGADDGSARGTQKKKKKRGRINSAAPYRGIALEAGLKDHFFLQFLRISATGAPPGRPQKWIFFVILEPFHSTRFCSGNVSFQRQNPTPELHFSEQKFCFFGRSVLRRQQIPY